MVEITKEMLIGDVLKKNMELAAILMKSGMHCLGCPSAQSESLEEAAAVHGIDIESLVNELNAFQASSQA